MRRIAMKLQIIETKNKSDLKLPASDHTIENESPSWNSEVLKVNEEIECRTVTPRGVQIFEPQI